MFPMKKQKEKALIKKWSIYLLLLSVACPLLIFLWLTHVVTGHKVLGTTTVALVPAIYEPITHSSSNGKTSVQLLRNMGVNFVFRGTFQWGKGSTSMHDFMTVSSIIQQFKKAVPHLIFEGGIGTQYLSINSIWPDGSTISSSDFASMIGGKTTFVYDASGYYPDLASQVFRKYLVAWGKRQIDEGVDGMFFDSPFGYVERKAKTLHYTQAQEVQAYKQYASYLYNGTDGVVKNLRAYAATKGKKFFVTINAEQCKYVVSFYAKYPYMIQPNDYVSCSLEDSDFTNPSLIPVENFGSLKTTIRSVMKKDVPIFVFIDWPHQMTYFKKLTTRQQSTLLTNIYKATKVQGMYFALPVYTSGAAYDSVAWGTYSTMLSLVGK